MEILEHVLQHVIKVCLLNKSLYIALNLNIKIMNETDHALQSCRTKALKKAKEILEEYGLNEDSESYADRLYNLQYDIYQSIKSHVYGID